jgi:hypothetical protein
MSLGGRHRLFATSFLRALATGMVGVLLGVYLARLEMDVRAVGIVIEVGLTGAVAAALLGTLAARLPTSSVSGAGPWRPPWRACSCRGGTRHSTAHRGGVEDYL